MEEERYSNNDYDDPLIKKFKCLRGWMLRRKATFNSRLLNINYSMSNEFDNSDVIIIGGGLAGLTTAALLARSGKTVTLFERSSKEIGGRARTTEVDGFYFNQGPHALFLTDAADSILKEIGITFTGGIAAGKGKSYLISGGKKREVSGDYGSWLSSGNGDGTLVETNGSQFFKSPTEMDFSQLEGVTVQEWLDKNIHDINDAEIIKAILRLNTYGNDPEIQSIGLALRQIYVSSRAGTHVCRWRLADTRRRTSNSSQKRKCKNCHGQKGNKREKN